MITLLNYGLTNCITKILEPIEILGQKSTTPIAIL